MSRRVEGVDLARGLASLIMIQGHAYDGWVSASHKATAAYHFTRWLGTFPLPAFLVLAGASLALRAQAAARRDEVLPRVRRRVVQRGLRLLAYGYVVSAAYAAFDGLSRPDMWLRADVLHVIGVSVVLVGALGFRGSHGRRRWALTMLVLFFLPILLCPWLSRFGWTLSRWEMWAPVRCLFALAIDVPPLSVMPAVPLVAWVACGALAVPALAYLPKRPAPAWALLVVAAAMAGGGKLLTSATLHHLGGTLTRAHPAVVFNALDLAGRGLLVLAIGYLVAGRLPAFARAGLLRLGRGSLVAYVFHIPFCYGVPGGPLRGRLSMGAATLAVVGLMALSFLVVWLRDALRQRRAPSAVDG